jgi:hypothetical protein
MGLSSYQTQEEIDLAEVLMGRNIPVVVIEDVPGSCLRPKAKDFAPWAPGLIIALGSVRDSAASFGYRHDRIWYVGPPPHWGASYSQMMNVDVRAERARVPADGFLVFVPGGKNPLITNTLLHHTINAGRELWGELFLLGFVPHPGEKAEKPEEESVFARAFEERSVMLEGVRCADMSRFKNPQRYAIANLVITTGGPTETIAAAYARMTNVVYYRDAVVMEWLAQSGVQNGRWFVPDLGGCFLAGPDYFVETVHFARISVAKRDIRESQERNFPLPESWDTAPAIVKVLEDIAEETQ